MAHPAPPRRQWLGAVFGSLTSPRFLAGALASAGCTTWPEPTIPMPTRRIAARGATRARCVLLPGALSRAEDFVTEGFVADLQAAAPACEIVLAEAHVGYFVEDLMLPRLRADVVQPGTAGASDASGTSGAPGSPSIKPWLVGISLGGFAALAYAMRHGREIAGVLVLAPYLGRRTLLRDITAAGGPRLWRDMPPVPGKPYETIEDDLWRWLARPGLGTAASTLSSLPIHLGYGLDDRFADAQRVLQSLLPAGHTHTVPGGHDWAPWRALWQNWLRGGWLSHGRQW